MSDTLVKSFPAVCPYCKNTWYPQSDGYTESSFCNECEPQRIQDALQARKEKGISFQNVGDYIVEVPTPEDLALGAQTLKEIFQPRLSFVPTDVPT